MDLVTLVYTGLALFPGSTHGLRKKASTGCMGQLPWLLENGPLML